MAFAPTYVECVLNENFADAKTLFLSPLMAVHFAHLVMLRETGIVSADDARAIRDALEAVPIEEIRGAVYDESCEDLFFYVERLIVNACGEDVAGRLHTARSRNDIDMTMYRMRVREFVLALLRANEELRAVLLEMASRHVETVFAVHTHTQPAQPTTVAHYLLAAIEQLERDAVRLRASYHTTNCNPLGACAITGTGFPIDRHLTSELLGFEGPTGNTYGSIATVDYLVEATSAAAVMLLGVGRLVQDLLLWCTAEFGYLRLGEGYVQSSSIMPQKRNPVALEHARSIGSKALGQAGAIMMVVHNTPFGDIVDTEDDLQPLVFSMFKDATRATRLVAGAMHSADFDVERLERRASANWITITELADSLTRDHGLPFRTSHAVAAALVEARRRDPGGRLVEQLERILKDIGGAKMAYNADALRELLTPQHFVRVRRTHGGPAPEKTRAAIGASRECLIRDRGWSAGATNCLVNAERQLAARSASL